MTTAPTPSDVERLASNLEHEWTTVADILKAAATLRQQQAEIEAIRETLEFVERWAVHHASKPHMTAELALGSIQHHPEISAITERYADGKRPDTFDPYARIAELEARKPLPPDALADTCEASLQTGGATNLVDAFEAGYRTAEQARTHGITGGSP